MVSINEPFLSVAYARNVIELLGLGLGAVWLGACAQSSVVTQKSEMAGNARQGSLGLTNDHHPRRISLLR